MGTLSTRLISYTHIHMESLKFITGTKTFKRCLIAGGMFLAIFLAYNHVSATVPSEKERAATMLPGVVREIDKTQEYADRNVAAKLCEKAILACQTGDCTAFAESDNCTGF